jgi:hypothetical protein
MPALLEFLHSVEFLTPAQKKIITDAIDALQRGYSDWLGQQPIRDRSLLPSESGG